MVDDFVPGMKFKPGQEVVFLRESGGGIVLEILDRKRIKVQDENGFVHLYAEEDLAPVLGSLSDVELDDAEKVSDKSPHGNDRAKETQRPTDIREIDLHIEELVPSHRGLTNHEILTKQMNELVRFMNAAMAQKCRNLVIIHGVGEGVLRSAVRSYLNSVDGVEYWDGNFGLYGSGTTRVLIRYNC